MRLKAIADAGQQRVFDLHYLVNNAGASGPRLLQDQDWQAHQDYLTLMMTSITELCHRLMPTMTAAGRGRVINVASVAGRIASGGDSHYGPSKAYVIALSEALALTVKGQRRSRQRPMPWLYPHGFSRYSRNERHQTVYAEHAVVQRRRGSARGHRRCRKGQGHCGLWQALPLAGSLDAIGVDTLDVQR